MRPNTKRLMSSDFYSSFFSAAVTLVEESPLGEIFMPSSFLTDKTISSYVITMTNSGLNRFNFGTRPIKKYKNKVKNGQVEMDIKSGL